MRCVCIAVHKITERGVDNFPHQLGLGGMDESTTRCGCGAENMRPYVRAYFRERTETVFHTKSWKENAMCKTFAPGNGDFATENSYGNRGRSGPASSGRLDSASVLPGENSDGVNEAAAFMV